VRRLHVAEPAPDAGWRRKEALQESLGALDHGNVVGVEAGMPTPLREALTKICPTCGHGSTMGWPASIPDVEEEVATLTKTIATPRADLDRHVTKAEALLAEAVTSSQ
jgi:hypothetical protein